MYSKIKVSGEIEVLTGMHIGGANEFSAIGAVDSPVIRDARDRMPMIPGSSLKGKLRTLLARKYNENIYAEHSEDNPKIKRLFGAASKGKNDGAVPSRLIFSDTVLANRKELLENGADSVTEVKFENTINRKTGTANPRQIERSIRGSIFPLEIIYEVIKEEEIEEDFRILSEGLQLLQYDYLGGNGSRGYGKVKFRNIGVEVLFGSIDGGTLAKCTAALKGVEQ